MKKLKLFTLSALVMSFSAFSQESSISIEASQNITNFKFVNSEGIQDKNYNVDYSGGYALGYRYKLDFGLFFGAKLGMRQAGATYVYDNTNYQWRLNYAEARLQLGYSYSFGKLAAHINVQPYFAYLLKANQRLNNEDFDIIDTGEMKRIDYGLFASPGVSFQANDYINIYLDLNYMFGLANLETNEAQTSNNLLYGATLGAAFTIK
ncbi:MAG: outer membrane beta-barrel protein [Crocinitomicaceae bacterium]